MSTASISDLKSSHQSTAVKTRDPVIDALVGAMGKIKNVLPSLITPERMLRIVTNELRVNEKLAAAAKKNPSSLVNAVCVAARCGLEIGGPNPQGHLVPHGNEIVFYPDYRGKIELMRRSGILASFTLELVYEKDEFALDLGFDTKVTHKPFLRGDRGEVLLGYFAAKLTNGETMFIWMTKDAIDKIKKKSRSGGSGPWVSDWEEMAKKTVVHRASKIMPQSTELRIATGTEDAADAGRLSKLNDQDPDVIDMGATFVGPDDGADESASTSNQAKTQTSTETKQQSGDMPSEADLTERLNGATTADELEGLRPLINEIPDPDAETRLLDLFTDLQKKFNRANQRATRNSNRPSAE